MNLHTCVLRLLPYSMQRKIHFLISFLKLYICIYIHTHTEILFFVQTEGRMGALYLLPALKQCLLKLLCLMCCAQNRHSLQAVSSLALFRLRIRQPCALRAL